MLQKIPIIWKKNLSKSCLIEFPTKKLVGAFASLQSGARGLKRLICLKYYIALKWKSIFKSRKGLIEWHLIIKLFQLKEMLFVLFCQNFNTNNVFSLASC